MINRWFTVIGVLALFGFSQTYAETYNSRFAFDAPTTLVEDAHYRAQRQGRFFVISLKTPHQVLSSSAVNGGQSTAIGYLVNHQSMEAQGDQLRYMQQITLDRQQYHRSIAEQLRIAPQTMALLATEAKSAALAELAVSSKSSSFLATGTGTDQIIIASPIATQTPPLPSASGHLKLGELVGSAVRVALLEALSWQNRLQPSSAADLIYADKASTVGSIGVIGSGFGFDQLMAKVGVERRTYTAGGNKDFLDPFLPQKENHKVMFQQLLDEVHQQFISQVELGRGDRLVPHKDLYSGAVFHGARAVELGLIDGLGSLHSVSRDQIGVAHIVFYSPEKTPFQAVIDELGVQTKTAISWGLNKGLMMQ